jgi:hypothetical protein
MDEIWGYFAVLVVFFGVVFGSLAYSEHMKHIEKMECMAQRGEYINSGCFFREQKPAQ